MSFTRVKWFAFSTRARIKMQSKFSLDLQHILSHSHPAVSLHGCGHVFLLLQPQINMD